MKRIVTTLFILIFCTISSSAYAVRGFACRAESPTGWGISSGYGSLQLAQQRALYECAQRTLSNQVCVIVWCDWFAE